MKGAVDGRSSTGGGEQEGERLDAEEEGEETKGKRKRLRCN